FSRYSDFFLRSRRTCLLRKRRTKRQGAEPRAGLIWGLMPSSHEPGSEHSLCVARTIAKLCRTRISSDPHPTRRTAFPHRTPVIGLLSLAVPFSPKLSLVRASAG